MSTLSSDRRAWTAGVGLFLFALFFRFVGVTWGLPNDLRNQSLHPDEAVLYSNYAYQPNPLIPGNYNYPSFYPVLVRLAGDMVATYGNFESPLGAPEPTSMEMQKALNTRFSPHQRAVNLAGRVISCIAGATTVAVIFILLLPFLGLLGALLSGMLTALAPSFLVHSRFQTVDVTATMFFWLALLYAVRIYQRASGDVLRRDVLLAGVFAGLSAGTKYTGVVALASVAVALYLSNERSWIKLFVFSVLACLAVFVVTTPGALLDTRQFIFGLKMESLHAKQGQELTFASTPPGIIYQVGNLFTGIGPLAFCVGLFGLGLGLSRKTGWVRVLVPALLLHFMIIAPAADKFARYGLPLVPAIACGFGYVVSRAFQRPTAKLAGGAAGVISLLGLESMLLLGFRPSPATQAFDPRFGGLFGAVRFTQYMSAEDPRDSAGRYLRRLSEPADVTAGILNTPWYWTNSVFRDASFLYGFPEEVHEMAVQQYLATTSRPRVAMLTSGVVPEYATFTSFELLPVQRISSAADLPRPLASSFIAVQAAVARIQTDYEFSAGFGDIAPAVEDLQYIQPRAEVWRLRR